MPSSITVFVTLASNSPASGRCPRCCTIGVQEHKNESWGKQASSRLELLFIDHVTRNKKKFSIKRLIILVNPEEFAIVARKKPSLSFRLNGISKIVCFFLYNIKADMCCFL